MISSRQRGRRQARRRDLTRRRRVRGGGYVGEGYPTRQQGHGHIDDRLSRPAPLCRAREPGVAAEIRGELTPMLMGRASSMNSIAVFAGLLFWSWMWGVPGMLLAVPLMMVVKVICDHVEAFQPVGHLLGE